ncbi:MAG: hypothetical protein VX346_17080 [Planctomycetota bacterium]|nr:hypothetical protein [Planctomycetota bacterium]
MPAFTVCRKSVLISASGRYSRCFLWVLLDYVSAQEPCKMVGVAGVAVFVGAYLTVTLQSKTSIPRRASFLPSIFDGLEANAANAPLRAT